MTEKRNKWIMVLVPNPSYSFRAYVRIVERNSLPKEPHFIVRIKGLDAIISQNPDILKDIKQLPHLGNLGGKHTKLDNNFEIKKFFPFGKNENIRDVLEKRGISSKIEGTVIKWLEKTLRGITVSHRIWTLPPRERTLRKQKRYFSKLPAQEVRRKIALYRIQQRIHRRTLKP
ncbi:MAG: hypothetical protein Q7K42_06005 [Candidatus Diapherotrites archaeon]|nr:hypothetical protein [Candidatus Diapherotrites archaeon]